MEIHLLTPDGLRAVVDAPIHGRIATLKLFKPPLATRHLLFLATERGAFCVLAYDASKGELVTEAMGDLTDRIGRPAECGQIGIVDPECRVAGAHLYDGLFKCLPLDRTGQLREAFNVRLDELRVVDIAFLHGCARPTIAVLHQDAKEARHVKTYEIDLKTKDLVAGPWAQADLEGGTSRIIPVPAPLGGAILLGETVIVYVDGGTRHPNGTGEGADGTPSSAFLDARGKAPAGAPSAPAAARDQWGSTGSRGNAGNVTVRAVATRAAPFMAHGAVDADGSRVLLSDCAGVLHLLVLAHDGNRVTGLKLEPLGETSVASAISYLDNGVAFVGSAYGDSQLVRLHAQPVPLEDADDGDDSGLPGLSGAKTTYVEILETFPNLGPIVDMAVVDLDRHGQGQVVTCSGVAKDGSLRVVRNGVGIHERAAAELPGIKGCWSLKPGDAAPHDTFLVVTFMRETRVLAVDDASDELGECEFEGFRADEQTLWTGNVAGGLACQVTPSGVRLADAATGAARASWCPGDRAGLGDTIGVASGNSNVVVVATSSGALVSLRVGAAAAAATTKTSADVDGGEDEAHREAPIAVVATADPGGEVACLDCSPLEEGKPPEACAVGLWSAEVKTFAVPGLRLLSRAGLAPGVAPPADAAGKADRAEPASGSDGPGASASGTIPRAVLLCQLDGTPYLLVGTGDGGLRAYVLATSPGASPSGALDLGEAPKTVSLGARPATLRAFRNKGARHVFAGSDRPTVIYGSNGKLVFSTVNVPDVAHASPFDCAAFPDSLALCSDADLVIGGVDDIQKLHVRAVPLGEQPRRIAHQPATNTFAVLTQREGGADANGDEHFVRLLDAETFETKHTFPLLAGENDGAVVSCAFADDPASYFVVGTAFAAPEEVEPSRGRVLVLKVVRDALVLVAEKEVKGAVYNLNAFNGKLLAGVNSKVQLFRWAARDGEGGGSADAAAAAAGAETAEMGDHELIGECSHHGHIVALYVRVRGDLIVVGDLMKSVSLLRYEPAESAIVEIARDFNPNWMTAVDALDDDAYVGAENSFNLFTLLRNSDASTDEERSRLDVAGEFHLGEFVNRFRRGSLVAKSRDAGEVEAECVLFGTVNGVLGVLASVDKDTFEFALNVQNAMNQVVQGVGGLSHEKWRSFHNEHQTRPARGFVDGDAVERFLDLKKETAKKVAALAGVSAEEITRRVEALQRVTH